MFTTLKYRRQVAVLAALAMVASVLVAAPAVAADPKPDYPATFDACVGGAAESAGFEDVPANHANAGDIDCIAYYGITRGTSATTYSPSMSVTREHMALFLTRLAGLVGIAVASTPANAGFTDIGELSAESQTAINQLADLGITRGTSATTYSPGDSVTRSQMGLFIARLMDKMDPIADGATMYGYTPEDVVNVADGPDDDDLPDKTVMSPYTDLGAATKSAYDAVTALYELGVVSGISDTAYGPSALITRASMAEFMAGVLDHSNARPAGVSIQASKTWDFGGFDATVAASYRDDSFAPMVDVSIKAFDSDTVGKFTADGGCAMAADCAWTDDESLTDASGNIFDPGSVSNGEANTYYAWMGDANADSNDFNVNTSPHASVTLSSTTDAVNLKVTSDINSNSTGGNTVDIDVTSSVTYTVQLVDATGGNVAKPGVEISVGVNQGGRTLYPGPAPMKTDDDGMVTYTTSGPKSTKGNTDPDRTDRVTFTSDVDGTGTVGAAATTAGDPAETVVATIVWTDSNPTLVSLAAVTNANGDTVTRAAQGSGKGSTAPYAFLSNQNRVTIRATVSFYDQYGNPVGKGERVAIAIGTGTGSSNTRTVSSRGMAGWSRTLDGTLGTGITVAYALRNAADDAGLDGAPSVTDTSVISVRHADDNSSRAAADIDAVYGDENRFRIGGALYTYDSDDVFLQTVTVGGVTSNAPVDMAKFAMLIGANRAGQPGTQANIEVVAYNSQGSSIFRVVTEAS